MRSLAALKKISNTFGTDAAYDDTNDYWVMFDVDVGEMPTNRYHILTNGEARLLAADYLKIKPSLLKNAAVEMYDNHATGEQVQVRITEAVQRKVAKGNPRAAAFQTKRVGNCTITLNVNTLLVECGGEIAVKKLRSPAAAKRAYDTIEIDPPTVAVKRPKAPKMRPRQSKAQKAARRNPDKSWRKALGPYPSTSISKNTWWIKAAYLPWKNYLRSDILEFLQWNDSDGVFTDAASRAEGVEPLTRAEAMRYLVEQIKDVKSGLVTRRDGDKRLLILAKDEAKAYDQAKAHYAATRAKVLQKKAPLSQLHAHAKNVMDWERIGHGRAMDIGRVKDTRAATRAAMMKRNPVNDDDVVKVALAIVEDYGTSAANAYSTEELEEILEENGISSTKVGQLEDELDFQVAVLYRK